MTLGSHLASPTPLRTAAGWLVVARMRLGDYGLLVESCADALGLDDDARESFEFGDPRTRDWLYSDGLALFLWLVLRRDRPGLLIEDAEALAITADDAVAVVAAAFRRGKFAPPKGGGGGTDIATADWAASMYWLAKTYRWLPGEVAEMSLDQLHNLMAKGEDGRSEGVQAAMQAQWVERMREKAAEAKARDEMAPVTLESLGYRIVEDGPTGDDDGRRDGDGHDDGTGPGSRDDLRPAPADGAGADAGPGLPARDRRAAGLPGIDPLAAG